MFLLNYTEKKQPVDLGQTYRDALTGATGLTAADLPPYGVEVLIAQ
jgi:hypothetical protein